MPLRVSIKTGTHIFQKLPNKVWNTIPKNIYINHSIHVKSFDENKLCIVNNETHPDQKLNFTRKRMFENVAMKKTVKTLKWIKNLSINSRHIAQSGCSQTKNKSYLRGIALKKQTQITETVHNLNHDLQKFTRRMKTWFEKYWCKCRYKQLAKFITPFLPTKRRKNCSWTTSGSSNQLQPASVGGGGAKWD